MYIYMLFFFFSLKNLSPLTPLTPLTTFLPGTILEINSHMPSLTCLHHHLHTATLPAPTINQLD